ncbi:hypothetical protein BS47DRAFT_1312831 [Hydnum rufescens UP504]|uniref:Ribosomal protein L10 n=1 Tax=Hydnum rufescens UP504 TaxID=1448309 RepID=A0A9P6E1S3_9AGAM|nr:hypothetical protein BS47DRAFT_1312831 [Hydnum rufescens UP504]
MNPGRQLLSTPSRRYATVAPKRPAKRPPIDPNRVFTPRKTQLREEYARILASNALVLLLRHSNLPQSGLDKIRKDLSALTIKKSPSLLSPSPSTLLPPPSAPKFTVIRPGVFTASLASRYDQATVESARCIFGGPFALVTSKTFDPPQLSQIVRLIDRAIPPKPAGTPGPTQKSLSPDDLEDERPKEKAPPSIQLAGAFVEGRFVLVEGIKEIGRLPTLETLHAQIVGLLSAPGSKLAQVLSIASGGDVLRTLQGFEKGLQESQKSQ